MEIIQELWSPAVVLISAFIIGWGAEAAQTFIPRALALSVLAWLQTLPEFAVEAAIAWSQQRDLMIANLTGSLRLLVGLGWPMIFFVHLFSEGRRQRRFIKELRLEDSDALSVLFLFLSVVYFILVLVKGSLTVYDGAILIAIYLAYLYFSLKLPVEGVEDEDELPYVARKVVRLSYGPRIAAVILLFIVGGAALLYSVEPFIHTLKGWATVMGISTFVFIQWIAPFLSEFPEKVTAFSWALHPKKAPMAVMNMVSSNINQWTMLAAMIPIVFSVSLGHVEPVQLDSLHRVELALTIAQSFLGGLLLLDLSFSLWEAGLIFMLWLLQFVDSGLREEVLIAYLIWSGIELIRVAHAWIFSKHPPRAFSLLFLAKENERHPAA